MIPAKETAIWKHRRAFICSVILILGALWHAYMPMQKYRPFCNDLAAVDDVEFYDHRLSEVYQESLRGALDATDTPYFELGNVFIVPLIAPGYGENDDGFLWRFFDGIVDDYPFIWSETNGKVASSAVISHRNQYPEGEVAKLFASYWRTTFDSDPAGKDYKKRAKLWCELVETVADPLLESTSRTD